MPAGRTLRSALREAEAILLAAGVDAPRVQATALLCAVLHLDRAATLARLDDRLLDEPAARFGALVARRAAREPLQYLLGKAPFLDFEVRVGPGVFIPRPETEQLVEAALAAWDPALPLAIDLCTGSAAIAIALARERRDARVLAVDLSPEALAAARASAAALGVSRRIDFVRADLLAALRPGPWRERLGVIVCNPPYVPPHEITQPEVRDWEPALALHAGTDGLDVYRRLIPQAARLLPAGRPLLLEIGFGQQESVPGMLEASGAWRDVRVEADFQGIPRVLSAVRGGGGGHEGDVGVGFERLTT